MLLDFLYALPDTLCQGLIWGIMAIGVFISYKVLNLSDLTVDGSICTGACVSTILIYNGVNAWISLLVAFIAGCITGILTGVFHAILKIPAILAGIITQLILWSINLLILGLRANLSISARQFNLCVTGFNITSSLIVLLVISALLVGFLYWFFGTELGCSIRATGNNEKMSKAQGINVNYIKILGLALSNGIVAFAGSLLSQFQGFTDINMGRGAIVIGLASIVVGVSIVQLFTKNFAVTLVGCLVGAIIYFLIYQFVIFLGFDTNLLKMLSAIIVLIFLGAPALKGYFKKRGVARA